MVIAVAPPPDPCGACRPDRPTALVTGGSRGIGLAIASALAPNHRVVLVGRRAQTLADAAQRVRAAGDPDVATIVADLHEPADRAALLAALAERSEPVTVLVNNAGIAHSAPLGRTDDAAWARSLALNLTAPFELARALVPGMVEQGWGRIIDVVSTAALKGYRYTAAYSASKAGLLGLNRALAAELASKGVTVNAVCPGFTDTAIVEDAVRNIASTTGRSEPQARASLERFSPLGRLVDPPEVAALVAYLASNAAGAITGQALAIDGGETTL